MEEVADPDSSDAPSASLTYFMPHHCVMRPDSTTTKLRVVFDGSCDTDTGVSLNDALMVGPVVQQDLYSIILRFRLHQFVLISDIEKMYRQIVVHPDDRPLQMIVWRNSPSEPLRFFQLSTVTYGTSCAPYLATKCLVELAKYGEQTYPEAAKVVARDFYMDDLLTGVDSVAEGQQLCSQLQTLLESAGFVLRKWSSNCPSILEKVPPEFRDERAVLELESSSATVKTLGLQWDTKNDQFLFNVPKWSETLPITKRIMASDAAKLFDPYGLVGPVIVQAKLALQRMWEEKKSWDEPLDETIQQNWLNFRQKLESLRCLTVPRWVTPVPKLQSLQLHGFCDASMKAYGACIYLRAEAEDGTVTVNLLTAKSRVAPPENSKKRITLPRLELSATLLLAHQYQKVVEATNLQVQTFLWTDSEICLYWLAGNPSTLKPFVGNRASEVQSLTPNAHWLHVPGIDNPADIISRGMDPDQLQTTDAWWHGPAWLSQPSRFWPEPLHPVEENFEREALEQRIVSLPVQTLPPNQIFELRSSYTNMLRLVAWLKRFAFNSKPANRNFRRTGFMRVAEYNEAENILVSIAQSEVFSGELASLSNNQQVSTQSKLNNLAPFLSDDGIIRVGGRLRNAPVSENRKHPIILPSKHPLTDLIARHYHANLLHAKPQLLVARMREKFWPLRSRNLARRIVHSCVRCFRCRPQVQEQLMGDLPPERVNPTVAFLKTGVDLCGPLKYRHPERRASHTTCYVAIFVCMATKAVHIELVGDLTTGAFIAALRRFTSRRGRPLLIECDNATNFTGAARELATLRRQFNSQQMQHDVTRACADDRIEFKFIPPRSPNFGGLWEAAVKSFKQHLKATLGTTVLTVDQLTTLLAQIEACLNSRPITQMSTDPQDCEALTPGHFLIHRPLTAIPEPSLEGLPLNRLDRWQVVQEFLRRIWKRWVTEYLSGLQQRTKWTRQRDNIHVGTMVLVKDDNLPPMRWRLGRVVQVISGNDGNIRVVEVKTKDGVFTRAISKICVLPIRQPSQPAGPDDVDDL